MAMTNNIVVSLVSTLTGTDGLAAKTASLAEIIQESLTSVACSLLYSTSGTISGGADEYDLAGSLKTPIGDAAVFAKAMLVFIRNNGTNAMTVGAANNIPIFADTSDKLTLAKNAWFLFCNPAGVTVTAGTGDLITIAGTNADTYDLIVIGAPAA